VEPERETSQVVTVMTANVAAGLAPDAAIEAAVRAELPDIVAFQELTQDQANRLREALADLYGHVAFIADGNEGRGVMSRLPIQSSRAMEFAVGRPDSITEVEINGMVLTVVVAHPRPQRITRSGLVFEFSSLRQMMHLANHTLEAAPAVMVGDFNMSPRHPGYRRLRQLGLQDAWFETGRGWGLTFPTRIGYTKWSSGRLARGRMTPVVRFDYIWCTADITIQAAWVGPDTGSDHAPVLARLAVPLPAP